MRRLRILVAPDKFRGSLGAAEAAAAIARGLRRSPCVADVVCVPMADGGEGTVDVFLAGGAGARTLRVQGPLGAPVLATFALEGDVAVIEMASAAGQALVAAQARAPLAASTAGVGELLRAALDAGARRVVLGIGGSATTDGGAGFLTALGARFLDAAGAPLPPGGAALARLATIDVSGLDPRLAGTRIDVACDVDVPLLGPTGAARMFGPQKGASAADVAELEAALARFADATAIASGRDRRAEPGTGAAGGLGFALLAFLGASLMPGVELVAEIRGLGNELARADLCLTGEGRIDDQTLRGKTVAGVARLARNASVPVVAFAGSVELAVEPELARLGVAAVIPIANRPMSLSAALAEAPELLEAAAARVGRLVALGAFEARR